MIQVTGNMYKLIKHNKITNFYISLCRHKTCVEKYYNWLVVVFYLYRVSFKVTGCVRYRLSLLPWRLWQLYLESSLGRTKPTMLPVCTDDLYYKRKADWVGHKIRSHPWRDQTKTNCHGTKGSHGSLLGP